MGRFTSVRRRWERIASPNHAASLKGLSDLLESEYGKFTSIAAAWRHSRN
jgi:hypothetical protein